MRNFAAELKRKCLRLVDSPDQTVFDRHRVSNSQIVGCPLWLDTGLWRSLQVDMEAAHFYNNNIVLSWQPRTTCKFANMRKYVFLGLLLAATSVAAQSRNIEPEKAGQGADLLRGASGRIRLRGGDPAHGAYRGGDPGRKNRVRGPGRAGRDAG